MVEPLLVVQFAAVDDHQQHCQGNDEECHGNHHCHHRNDPCRQGVVYCSCQEGRGGERRRRGEEGRGGGRRGGGGGGEGRRGEEEEEEERGGGVRRRKSKGEDKEGERWGEDINQVGLCIGIRYSHKQGEE